MQSILLLLLKYKYLVLFPLAAIEGPVVSLIVGFLVFSGVLSFWPSYIILLFGDIVPDTIYYLIGYFGEKTKFVQKHLFQSDIFKNHMGVIKKLWTEHTFKTMFFGKLAYGMAIPFLISAGITKITYRRFILHTIPITLFQYGVIMLTGYYLGSSYALALKYVDYAYFLMAIFVILFIFIYIFATKYAKKKIIAMEKNNE